MFLKKIQNNIFNLITILISIVAILFILELGLRLKNYIIVDYDVEMWKYSKKLKIQVENLSINHVHKKNSSAVLQNVEVNINSLGIRGTESDLEKWTKSKKKILLLGSSITLGWGVKEDLVLNNILEDFASSNNLDWATLNGGIGNYNTKRYISNFFENYKDLEPDIILVQYFINDAEILNPNSGNLITRNFHLGVMLWKYLSTMKSEIKKESIYEYYKNVYEKEKNDKIVKNHFKNLKSHCSANKIRCIVVYTPDLNLIKSHAKLAFARDYISEISEEIDLEFFDLTPSFKEVKNDNLTNSKYNDRHPNFFSHNIMAKEIYNYLIN